jgi:peptide/nickel transport system substrate-binding protein
MSKVTTMLVALAWLAGTTAAAGSVAAALPEIRVADAIDTPTSMPGHRSRNTATDAIMLHVVESLVALRDDLSVAPMLADSWTISPDGKTYQFKLRSGVTFHNGAPFTSADVVWSLNRILDPASESYCRNQYDGSKGAKVVGVTATAPNAVTVVLDQPNALFLQQMANVQCPLAILHRSSVDARGKWIKPVGTGPFMFGEWRKGQFLQLPAYPGYVPRTEAPSGTAGAKKALANLRYVVIPDAAAQKAAFMSGQVDLIVADGENPPPKGPGWNIVVEQDQDLNVLLMQSRDPLLAKPEFRRAVALSLDLAGLAKALTNGNTTYNPSLVPAGTTNYSPVHAAGYGKNAAEAAKLLAAAGYRGEPVKIQTNKRYPEMYRLAVVTQNMLSRAGIKAEVEVIEWATQVTNFREGKFQMMAFSYSARLDPAIMYGDVLGDKAKTAMSQWSNPEAIKILAGIKGVSDPARRKSAFEDLHRRMLADVPLLEVYNSTTLLGVSKRLTGFKPWPLRRPRFFNVSKN